MAVNVFKKKAFSAVYQKHMAPASNEILDMILSYLKVKTNGRPLEMALDVGCGTGRYTLPLASHFKNVLGTDISESQINLAKQNTLPSNVSYMVAPAENLPLKDASVDLVNAGLAIHWFTLDKFASEAIRVLKPKGCLAAHAFFPRNEIEYGDLSHDLSTVMSEVWDTLLQVIDRKILLYGLCQYQNVYEAIPLEDKERITDIPIKFEMSFPELIGFIQSICIYELFLEKDRKSAEQFLTQTVKRFREILGEEADSARLKMQMTHYLVLACKN